ncbi:hypothetical protein P0E69_06935 [Chimaeribacter arupi]|uniref:hypothetical protein n=1 Tax=Chimaeribacter arupi TaxID=2060066 RepID=UPI000C7CD5F4|nr:hypothetical protein [Chimaeribacter arupi]PLR52424.1 hypothetical protein CYR52_07655 [Chimaeribacter arupi]WKZ93624.1 hypothetical protein P0E69_06935 [Chimaeribacter arupi]
MPIYTDDPGQGINQPIGNAPAGLGESLAASFGQGFRDGPLMSGIRFAEADAFANDTASPVVSKAEADAKLKELGVRSINIPEAGVTQSFLDHVTESRKEALAKQQIAAAAPSGFIASPLNVLAGMAGFMADPANLALSLVPFAGEARAATFLGRAGERFVQGAVMGGAQTAVTLPFTAQASAAEGEDFTMAAAMENLFYGTVGGGILHAGGGVIADVVRGRRPAARGEEAPPVAADNIESAPRRSGDPSDSATPPFLDDAIAREADSYAYSRAYDEVLPDYRSNLESAQSGRVENVADLRAEIASNGYQASRLDETLSDRVAQYQQQRVKYREARQRAQRDIEQEKQALQGRNDEINQTLERNAAAERATGEQAAISRGEIPEGLKRRIEERAGQIKGALQKTPLAQGVRTAAQKIDAAHWSQRHSAFRAGISHMLQGRSPDVEPIFDLTAPELRESAVRQIQRGPRPDEDAATARSSAEAEIDYQRASRENAELVNAQEDLAAELELARNMTDDLDSPELRQALDDLTREANDESIIKGLQAYAACMLRRI